MFLGFGLSTFRKKIMKNINGWIICVVFTVLSLQVSVGMFLENLSLKKELRLSEKSKQICTDQIGELMHVVNTLQLEKDMSSTQHFVAGVLETLKNKDYYSEIWHDGYYRGEKVGAESQVFKNVSDHQDKK